MIRFFIALLLLATPAGAQLTGKVVKVADGDTFTMLVDGNRQVKVRLHGIDCPERGQDFGKVATSFAADFLIKGDVKVYQTDTDRYGRNVGIVVIDSDTLNVALLKAGLAWHYYKYDQRLSWMNYEKEARDAKLGLWKQENAIAPWIWRKVYK